MQALDGVTGLVMLARNVFHVWREHRKEQREEFDHGQQHPDQVNAYRRCLGQNHAFLRKSVFNLTPRAMADFYGETDIERILRVEDGTASFPRPWMDKLHKDQMVRLEFIEADLDDSWSLSAFEYFLWDQQRIGRLLDQGYAPILFIDEECRAWLVMHNDRAQQLPQPVVRFHGYTYVSPKEGMREGGYDGPSAELWQLLHALKERNLDTWYVTPRFATPTVVELLLRGLYHPSSPFLLSGVHGQVPLLAIQTWQDWFHKATQGGSFEKQTL